MFLSLSLSLQMMSFTAGLGHHPSYIEWLGGWREWARTRKRGRMAQFIIEKLEEGVSYLMLCYCHSVDYVVIIFIELQY